jgi:hypothetical protein
MAWSEIINPLDDKFHKRTDDLWWNESSYIAFPVMPKKLFCILYFYFRPNQKLAVGGPVLHDGAGDDIYNYLLWAWDTCMPMPGNAEMYEFEFPNGFAAKTLDLQNRYRFLYDGLGVKMDLTMSAAMVPFYTIAKRGKAISEWAKPPDEEEIFTGHYEQGMWTNGMIEVNGEKIVVDKAPTLRDHSWGPRAFLSNKNTIAGAYAFGLGSEKSSFHSFAIPEEVLDPADPLFDSKWKVINGWYTKDGVLSALVSGVTRCLERGDDGRPLRLEIKATDELGRKMHVDGAMETCLRWTGYTNGMDQWCIYRWEFDGQVVWGELQDYFWFPQYKRLLQRLRSQRAKRGR